MNRLNLGADPTPGVHTVLLDTASALAIEGSIELMRLPKGYTCKPIAINPKGNWLEVKLLISAPPTTSIGDA